MTKLLLMGSPYWCVYLQGHLARKGIDATFISNRFSDMTKLFRHRDAKLLAVGYGVGLSPGRNGFAMPLRRVVIYSVILAWWLLGRREGSIILYWIGRDVLNAQASSGFLARVLGWTGARHICGAPWFVDMLRGGGIEAQPVLFPYDTSLAENYPQPVLEAAPLRICAYLSEGGWDNMNGYTILELAKLTPQVQWTVMGIDEAKIPGGAKPAENMRFVGWVKDPLAVFAGSHAFIRIVNHDAYSGTVREALAMSKTVLYSIPAKGAIDISGKSATEIAGILTELQEALSRPDPPEHLSRFSQVRQGHLALPSFDQQIDTLIDALELDR